MRWDGRLVIVTLPEEVDMSNGPAVRRGLAAVLGEEPAAVVVDMTPTIYCDSAGVRAVMAVHRQAAASGRELRLVIASPGVRRVFSLIGADELATVTTRLTDALALPAAP